MHMQYSDLNKNMAVCEKRENRPQHQLTQFHRRLCVSLDLPKWLWHFAMTGTSPLHPALVHHIHPSHPTIKMTSKYMSMYPWWKHTIINNGVDRNSSANLFWEVLLKIQIIPHLQDFCPGGDAELAYGKPCESHHGLHCDWPQAPATNVSDHQNNPILWPWILLIIELHKAIQYFQA